MKRRAAVVVIAAVALVGFVAWCYYPHADAKSISIKMRVPLPGLHSQCVVALGHAGGPGSISMLLSEMNTASWGRRVRAARALNEAGWRPSTQEELALQLVASGEYEQAAALGGAAVEPLISEFLCCREAKTRSRLCGALLGLNDARAADAVADYLRQKLDRIGAVVKSAVPAETRVEALMHQDSVGRRSIVVVGHLLEGNSPDDSSPYVRGDYSTNEQLEALARERSCEVYRSIFRTVPMYEFSSVTVQCRHGVRVHVLGEATPDQMISDEATTILQTSVSPTLVQRFDWEGAAPEDIQHVWKIDVDLIPSLTIVSEWSGR